MAHPRRLTNISYGAYVAQRRYYRRGAWPLLALGIPIACAYVGSTLYISGGNLWRLVNYPILTGHAVLQAFLPVLAILGAGEVFVRWSTKAAWSALLVGVAILLPVMVYGVSLNSRGFGITPLITLHVGFALAVALLPVCALAGLAALLVTGASEVSDVPVSPTCSACGYDLDGLEAAPRCPECGGQFLDD